MSLPGPLALVGKKQIEQFGRWLPSLVTFAGVGSLGLFYVTDWKVVVKYVPFYGGKFSEEE